MRPGTVLDLTYATEEDAARLICLISDEISPDTTLNDADRMSLMSMNLTSGSVGSSASSTAASAMGNHISWQGHSFQPMTFRIMNAICEVCRHSCSDLRSPPPALECIRCRMRIHRNHVENHEKFVVCPNTVKQWIIRAPSVNDRNAWISCINQLKKEAANLVYPAEALLSPGCVGRPAAPSTPHSVFNTLRYRSMRNFGGLSLKDIASRRSGASVNFPRHNGSSGVAGSATPGSVVQPAPAAGNGNGTSTSTPTPRQNTPTNFDGQHDL